jgi:DNA recombination protein RmuC
LLDEALNQHVILATPTSFVALLKAVAYGWRQVALAENAKQIRDLAATLYRRLATFTGHLSRVGRSLSGSVEAYNNAVGSLERQVLPGARRFTELGVQARKPMEPLPELETVARRPQAEAPDAPASRSRRESASRRDRRPPTASQPQP